jgi:hypothetical protein
MTKRQWFLVAGLAVLATACEPLTDPFCQYNEETGDQLCLSTAKGGETVTSSVELPNQDYPN